METLNELEKSLSVLLSLYVMIEQNFNALTYYETFFSEEADIPKQNNFPEKKELYIDEAIMESLWFQIILKSCSFLDEWDKVLGLITETKHKEKIHIIKRVVKPARKAIDQWTEIRSFRNEIIAHNFRNNKGEIKLYSINNYDCPQTNGELFYLIAFLNRMVSVLSSNLPTETQRIKNSMGNIYIKSSNEFNMDDSRCEKLKETLKKIDEYISEEIFALPRYDMTITLLGQ